jgi:hypothetical protein
MQLFIPAKASVEARSVHIGRPAIRARAVGERREDGAQAEA